MKYLVALICNFIATKLPLKFSYILASFSAKVLYLTWPRLRNETKRNMSLVLNRSMQDKLVSRAARKSIENFCFYTIDFLRYTTLKTGRWDNKVIFQGLENIDRALGDGRGAIIVGLHLGYWDMGGAIVAKRNYPLNVIVQHFTSRRLNTLLQSMRKNIGMKIISTREGINRMIGALRSNELIALLIDSPLKGKGVRVKFCNYTAEVPAGAALLALRTGAKIIPVGVIKLEDGTLMVHIGSQISRSPSGNLNLDIQLLTQDIMSNLEPLVKQYPDQWYIFHRMWV